MAQIKELGTDKTKNLTYLKTENPNLDKIQEINSRKNLFWTKSLQIRTT